MEEAEKTDVWISHILENRGNFYLLLGVSEDAPAVAIQLAFLTSIARLNSVYIWSYCSSKWGREVPHSLATVFFVFRCWIMQCNAESKESKAYC